jgi:hypothetical protein
MHLMDGRPRPLPQVQPPEGEYASKRAEKKVRDFGVYTHVSFAYVLVSAKRLKYETLNARNGKLGKERSDRRKRQSYRIKRRNLNHQRQGRRTKSRALVIITSGRRLRVYPANKTRNEKLGRDSWKRRS